MFYIQFKEKSNRNYSNVLTLQSLLLGFRSCCCCCCCPNEYIFVFIYSRESAQIPSLRFLWSVLPCWLHMKSIAFSQTAERSPSKQGHNRENELRTFVWIYHDKSFWSVWVELQQKYCFSFEWRGWQTCAISKLSIGLCSTLCLGATSTRGNESECHYAL